MSAWRRGVAAAALVMFAGLVGIGTTRPAEAAATVSAAPASSQPTPLGQPFVLVVTIRGGVLGQEYPVVIAWGDSASTNTSRVIANATRDSFNVSHTYGSAGTFSIFVSLPGEGASGSAQATIQSSNPTAPLLAVTPAPVTSPCGSLSRDPVSGQCFVQLGIDAFTLTATITDGDSNNWTVIIFWNDAGSPGTEIVPVVRTAPGAVPISAAHIYASYPNAAAITQRAIPTVDVVDGTYLRTSQTFPAPGLLIKDTTAPVVTVPGQGGLPPIPVVAADNAAGGTVVFGASATDNDPGMSFVCRVSGGPLPAGTVVQSGQVLPIGTTLISCVATDLAANSTSGLFTVTVADTTPPVFTQFPADGTFEAHDASGIPVTYAVQANDNVTLPANIVVTCDVASGSLFPIGATKVTCIARDQAGNQAVKSFTATVVADTTPPAVTVPEAIPREAAAPNTAVFFAASATDTGTPNPPVVCTPASGAFFPVGTTTVRCSATDAVGNTGTNSFAVTVVDTTPPTLTVPADITVAATSSSGSAVHFSATATDLVSTPTVACTPASGSTFPVGTTTVACTATDAANNSVSRSFRVTVTAPPPPPPADTTPPALKLPANITVLTGNPEGAVVTFEATATDTAPPSPAVTCAPASGSRFPAGTTTVNCTAVDTAGNRAAGQFTVKVTIGNKDLCKKDGWREFVDPSFKNQGDCVSYFATNGKNPPAGDSTRSNIVIGGVIAVLVSSLAVVGIVIVRRRRANG